MSADLFKLDRSIEWNGVEYCVLETLSSEHLLVVKKEDYLKENFPLLTYIIPHE
ncbi:hypothetical protein [Niallia taxi]|uniref:hypothetical protein n=1 Tax=Niallia taxi TaxID=2499688 RepID=UPI0013E2966B|nr:hypothetical protein [Niallia taxi]